MNLAKGLFILFNLPMIYLSKLCGIPTCKCNPDVGTILCRGSNITEMPTFHQSDTLNIYFLDIIDTFINETDGVKVWPQLEMITFINNTLLKCDELPQEMINSIYQAIVAT